MGTNFVDCFDIDLTSNILGGFLNNPADLIRASAVSRTWRHFVIANGLCKKLWLRKVPQIASIAYDVEESDEITRVSYIVSKNSANWETLLTEHKIYSSLLHPLSKQIVSPKDCLGPGVLSTDSHPVFYPFISDYGINNSPGGPYWSIIGESDPNLPCGIMYRLNTSICIVAEVNIQPPKGQSSREHGPGKPVYSENLVRFRIGHPKSVAVEKMMVASAAHMPSVGNYEWTYTSPLFPMSQEPGPLQFKLPEPVVCVSGVLHIEMFGRSRREEMDGLLLIFWGYVRVLGHSLEPMYTVKMFPSGECLLNYSPCFLDCVLRRISGVGSKSAYEPEDEDDQDVRLKRRRKVMSYLDSITH